MHGGMNLLPENYLQLMRTVEPNQLGTLMALIKPNKPKDKFDRKKPGYKGLKLKPPIGEEGYANL